MDESQQASVGMQVKGSPAGQPLDRRQWLRTCARYGVAGLLVIGSGALLARPGDPAAACSLTSCQDCRDLAQCREPRAMSRRIVEARREESSR